MLKVVLQDPRTEIEVEHDGLEGWSLRDAVQELTNKIAADAGVPPHEVLFNNEPFKIYAREVDV